MFILNNMHGRQHHKIYKTEDGQSRPIFDISEKQIKDNRNSDWNELKVGDFACVVLESRKMSTIYKIDSIENEEDDVGEIQSVIRGHIVGKFEDESEYIDTLNKYHVMHERLKSNKFPIGFNIANLCSQLDLAVINTTAVLANTLGELKEKL